MRCRRRAECTSFRRRFVRIAGRDNRRQRWERGTSARREQVVELIPLLWRTAAALDIRRAFQSRAEKAPSIPDNLDVRIPAENLSEKFVRHYTTTPDDDSFHCAAPENFCEHILHCREDFFSSARRLVCSCRPH